MVRISRTLSVHYDDKHSRTETTYHHSRWNYQYKFGNKFVGTTFRYTDLIWKKRISNIKHSVALLLRTSSSSVLSVILMADYVKLVHPLLITVAHFIIYIVVELYWEAWIYSLTPNLCSERIDTYSSHHLSIFWWMVKLILLPEQTLSVYSTHAYYQIPNQTSIFGKKTIWFNILLKVLHISLSLFSRLSFFSRFYSLMLSFCSLFIAILRYTFFCVMFLIDPIWVFLLFSILFSCFMCKLFSL